MKPVDLTKWTAETYLRKDIDAERFKGLKDKPDWKIVPDGKGNSVDQLEQSLPTFFYSDFNALGHTIEVTLYAEPSQHNNFIGFALNFKPGDTSNKDADFLLLNWLARDDHSPGLKLSQLKGIPRFIKLFGLLEKDKVAKAKTLGSVKWEHNKDYKFKFVFTKTKLQIWVNGSLEFDIDGSFEEGRFALFDCAQEKIDYKDIQADLAADSPPSWEKLKHSKLPTSDLQANDGFGWSVAVSKKTAIVGAVQKDAGGKANAGAAYIYQWDGGTWTKKAGPLQPSDLKGSDYFGYSVGITEKAAIVGVLLGDASQTDAGSAYIYQLKGATWDEKPALQHSEGNIGDQFGCSVAISEDVAIVGAQAADAPGKPNMGAAYIYHLEGETWTQKGSPLRPSDGKNGDQFGCSVAISGDVAIVGAKTADVSGKDNAGAAYIFERQGETWTQKQKLTSSDLESRDSFGYSVAISGKIAIVGANQAAVAGGKTYAGAAYIFELKGETWEQKGGPLQPSQLQSNDGFGCSVAISKKIAIVGANQADVAGKTNAGAAYIFELEGETWQLLKKPTQPLQPSELQSNDLFGCSVAISEEVAIVGAQGADTSGTENTGAVHVFQAGS
ncbi:MAG: hypothetical protein F6K14_11410 [Symploca sp. SIO2C1]|nr:hypothetical protein [Symploca sp. SIO2C1]